MMGYHKDNQYADTKRSEGYAKSITNQNIFETNESAKSLKYFQKDQQSLTSAISISKSRFQKGKLTQCLV